MQSRELQHHYCWGIDIWLGLFCVIIFSILLSISAGALGYGVIELWLEGGPVNILLALLLKSLLFNVLGLCALWILNETLLDSVDTIVVIIK